MKSLWSTRCGPDGSGPPDSTCSPRSPPTSGIELLPNVTLAPHALAWTSEMSRGNGGSCVQAILDVAEGRVPAHVVNRDVLERPGFQARLAAGLP